MYEPTANNSDSVDSGKLEGKTTASSELAGNAIGIYTRTTPDDYTEIRSPEVNAYVDVHASVGSLGGSVTLVSNTDTAGIVSKIGGIYVQGGASGTAFWKDTLTFATLDENGSDYVLKLGLDSMVSAGHEYSPDVFNNSQWGVSASANVTAVDEVTGFLFALGTYNSENGDNLPGGDYGEDDKRSAPAIAEKHIHVAKGQLLYLLLTGSLNVGASLTNVDATLEAQASHTALFAISTDDPLASYTSASGTVYATDVPEPTSTSLVLIAACGLLRRRKPVHD